MRWSTVTATVWTHVLQKNRAGFLEQNSDEYFDCIVGKGNSYVRSSETFRTTPRLRLKHCLIV